MSFKKLIEFFSWQKPVRIPTVQGAYPGQVIPIEEGDTKEEILTKARSAYDKYLDDVKKYIDTYQPVMNMYEVRQCYNPPPHCYECFDIVKKNVRERLSAINVNHMGLTTYYLDTKRRSK